MSDRPNPDDFHKNERPREYRVEITLEGTVTLTVQADSRDEAKKKALDQIEKDIDYGIELEEVEEFSALWVQEAPPMYMVRRSGKDMQVSRLEAGDLPREPNERERR